MKMLLTFYHMLYFAIGLQGKHQELKIFIVRPLGTSRQQFLYLKYLFQVRKKKNQTNQFSLYIVKMANLEAVLSDMKELVQKIDLIIDKKCQKEDDENRKRLAPITDTAILLERLGLAFRAQE